MTRRHNLTHVRALLQETTSTLPAADRALIATHELELTKEPWYDLYDTAPEEPQHSAALGNPDQSGGGRHGR